MARQFDDLKDGDTLEPYHINIIYRELRRLRKLKASPPLVLTGMQGDDGPNLSSLDQPPMMIQLTANGDSNGLHAWKEMHWNATTAAYEITGLTSSVADGDAAREINNFKCPLGNNIFEARRDNWGVLTFRAVSRYIAKTTTAITARSGTTPGSGNADFYTFDGTSLNSLSVNRTVWNFSGATGGLATVGTWIVVLEISGYYWIISAECS
jgi:hypothetical protein